MGVNRTGMYRLTGADLVAAGVRLPDVMADRLALSCQGEPVACRVLGADAGALTETSAIIFFGQALDTPFTDTNVYWLTWGEAPGLRMQAADLPGAGDELIPSHRHAIRLERNQVHAFLLAAPEQGWIEPWYWQTITPAQPAELQFELPHLVPGRQPVHLRVAVRGQTFRAQFAPDHHVTVEVNGAWLGEARFDDQASAIIEGELPAGSLKAAGNRIVVACPGDTEVGESERVYLDWIEVTYDSAFAASGGELSFSLGDGTHGRARATGLEGETAALYGVSSPAAPVYADLPPPDGGQVEAGLPAAEQRDYVLVTDRGYRTPAYIGAGPEPSLRAEERAADLIVIAHDSFIDAVEPLVERRRAQGLRVEVVPISRVYDEFSDGVFTPVAIRDFLAYAHAHWQRPAPGYVLLVGDASHDYRDYLGTGVPNYVPTYEVRVQSSILTASDAFFACVDGADHVPEMAVGRLPVSSADEAAAVVRKILAYEDGEPGDWQKRALFVADHEGTNNTPGKYEDMCRALANTATERGLAAEVMALRDVDPTLPGNERTSLVRERLTPRLTQAFADGALLIEFQGHGNEGFWSRQKVLTLEDVAGLKPSSGLPVCVDISCFTGWFDKPDVGSGKCLAEALLLAPQGGAVACIAPTRLGGLNLDAQLVPRLLAERDQPIGAVLRAARRPFIASQDPDVWDAVENYNLLGDPLLVLRLPAAAQVAETRAPARSEAPPGPAREPSGPPRGSGRTVRAIGAPRGDPSRPQGYIALPGRRLDTQAESPYQFALRPPDPKRQYLFLVQFLAGKDVAGKQALEEAGLAVLRELEQRAVVVRLYPDQADKLAERPEVQWMGQLGPWLKVSARLAGGALAFGGRLQARVECVEKEDAERLTKTIERSGGTILQAAPDSPATAIVVEMPAELAMELARDEGVIAVMPIGAATEPPRKEVPPR